MKTEVKMVTPSMAKQLLAKNINNRKLAEKTVNYYTSQMLSGNWMLTGQGISLDVDGNLIDGQHRLAAIVKSNMNIKMLVISDLPKTTFVAYDNGKARSANDVMHVSGISSSAKKAATVRKYFKFENEIKNMASGNGKEISISNQDILNKYYDKQREFDVCIKLTDRCYDRLRIYEYSTFCAFCSYLLINGIKYDVIEGYAEQLHGITPDEYICTRSCRDTLIKDGLSNKRLSSVAKTAMLIKSWNYYYMGENRNVRGFAVTENYPKIKL